MTPAGGRRRRSRITPLALLLGIVAASTGLLAPLAAADPTPSPGTPPLPVSVELGSLTPYAPQPGGTLRLAGVLRNTSAQAIGSLGVQLLLSHTKLLSRGEFDAYADTPDGPAPDDATAVTAAAVSLPREELAVGTAEQFVITVPVDALQPLEIWQVYELAVAVTGLPETSPTGTSETVGRLRTFLPYAPVDATGTGEPMQVAWLWPLVDRPHRSDDSTWTDDELAPELAANGRLGSLVQAARAAAAQQPPPPRVRSKRWERRHRNDPPKPPKPPLQPVPVTWAIDPALVDDVTSMAAGYRVGTGDNAKDGAGQQVAGSWLDGLRSAVAGGVVLPLPYADPDVTAAVRSQLTRLVQVALTANRPPVQDLGQATTLGYLWPPDGLLDQRALDALTANRVSTVILDSAALPYLDGTPAKTPGAHALVSARDAPGNVDALLIDHGLSAIVESGANYPTAGALAVQRLISELLMIQAELPCCPRAFVIAPDRRWDPDPGYAAKILSATGQVPWIAPVPLTTVDAAAIDTDVQRSATIEFPTEARQALLHREYLDGVQTLKRAVDGFALILPPGDPQVQSFDHGVLRLLSSAWRADTLGAAEQLSDLTREVKQTMDKVHIASKSGVVTLTSHSGTVPVTVTNDLDTAVDVVVGISDDDPRLAVEQPRVRRTIPPHRSVPVDIHATANVSGSFQIHVSLFTPDGRSRPYGEVVTLTVRSTAYGRTALLITGAATAALLVAVAVRLVRRARRARNPRQPEPVDA